MRFLAVLSLIASVSAAAIGPRSGYHMTQKEAQDLLELYGIYAHSSGGCVKKSNPKCTSYEGILSGTVWGVIILYVTSECPASAVVITGGTEKGHDPGPFSHEKGYKVNLRKTTCLDNYIRKFKKSGKCWADPDGNRYCDIGVAWDAFYK